MLSDDSTSELPEELIRYIARHWITKGSMGRLYETMDTVETMPWRASIWPCDNAYKGKGKKVKVGFLYSLVLLTW